MTKLRVRNKCATNLCVKTSCEKKTPEPASRVPYTSATPSTTNKGRCRQVPCVSRNVKVGVTKCHVCDAKRRSMSPSAPLATQTAAATTVPNRTHGRHQSHPNAINATRATQSESHGGTQNQVRHQKQPSPASATRPMQSES